MFLILVFVLLVLLIGYLSWNDHRSRKEFAKRNLKYVKVANLFFAQIFGKRVEITKSAAIEQYGSVFGFNMLGQYTILVAEPELLDSILCTNFAYFAIKRVWLSFFQIFLFFYLNFRKWNFPILLWANN